ncbi:hypothetical protein IQ264_07515 [Phormidium sp. LEGE 05292]|uniref:hypothetical protein n=1 Tax=[Phormidium] sp. LEGE 05292 TaxID=767427 RepID=UPI0018816545|nr:hypothetical protein [Phormidium sp. LEGE 05292]MBE9225279.1 hypothetical protein [Phormidium sp. LEGE 05292]
MAKNRRHQFRGIGKLQFWSFGKLRLSNFSALLSLLPLLIGGLFTVFIEGKAEARHTARYSEECCVVAQNFPPESVNPVYPNAVESAPFPEGFYGQLYRVYVPTYSDELLFLVQQEVTQSAYPAVYRGRRVIIVTQSDLARSRNFVRQLQRRGITAEMEVLSSNQALRDRYNRYNILPENNRYIVFVGITSRQNRYALLDRVLLLEPDARVERIGSRTVIVVRRLENRSEALTLVNELRRNGLYGRIYVAPIRQIEPEISGNQNRFYGVAGEPEISGNQNRFAGVALEPEISNNVDRFTPVQTQRTRITAVPQTSYELVIPIEQDELAAIEAQVRQMAIDLGKQNEVLIEANPNKSLLIIGPFNNLATVRQWEGYLREYGVMNAIIR